MTVERVDRMERAVRGLRVGGRSLVVGARADGEARLWHHGELPDGPSSIFEIGSVTKVVTATLLADLVRAGVVAYDDPVAEHLPEAPPMRGRPITLVDLATHHSGLPKLPAGLVLRGLTVDRHDPYAGLDEDRLRRAIRETAPTREPGVGFRYSNLGAGLLGHALARAAGTTYEQLVADRVTGPLGLRDTGVSVPQGAEHRLAQGHGWLGRPAGRWDLAGLVAAGGLVSTAADLLGFLGLHHPDATGPLAAAAADTPAKRHDAGRMLGVGLGWMVLPAGGPRRFHLEHPLLFHDGGTGGYRSFVAVEPATGTALVLLSGRARGLTGLGLRLARDLVGPPARTR